MQPINSTDQIYSTIFSKMSAANTDLIRVLETCDSFLIDDIFSSICAVGDFFKELHGTGRFHEKDFIPITLSK